MRKKSSAQGSSPQARLPNLFAEIDGGSAGYAYASRFLPGAAYHFTVENSVYFAERFQIRGVAGLMMRQLTKKCATTGTREMIAVIADPSISVASVRSTSVRVAYFAELERSLEDQ